MDFDIICPKKEKHTSEYRNNIFEKYISRTQPLDKTAI